MSNHIIRYQLSVLLILTLYLGCGYVYWSYDILLLYVTHNNNDKSDCILNLHSFSYIHCFNGILAHFLTTLV